MCTYSGTLNFILIKLGKGETITSKEVYITTPEKWPPLFRSNKEKMLSSVDQTLKIVEGFNEHMFSNCFKKKHYKWIVNDSLVIFLKMASFNIPPLKPNLLYRH